jgi:hypothetical protein
MKLLKALILTLGAGLCIPLTLLQAIADSILNSSRVSCISSLSGGCGDGVNIGFLIVPSFLFGLIAFVIWVDAPRD